jgi:hemolysin activation/secretion protein
VVGSTIFNPEELAKVTAPFTNRPITFAELIQVQEAITQLYERRGYRTSGAVIPPQTLEQGIVRVEVVEGTVEDIRVTGTRRLNPNYVRSRLAIGARQPLNQNQLVEALQLLQLNPLIQSISAELSAGSRLGANFLDVRVNEAKTFNVQVELDNNRSPAVGSLRRGARISEANLLGQGDALQVGYANTDGSNVIDFFYNYPVNPRNGGVFLEFQQSFNRIVEAPFDPLEIRANSYNLNLGFRQPTIETPTRLMALGASAYYRESQTSILGVPLQLSAGADEKGNTQIPAVRFFQEWIERGARFVFAARSEFNVGIGAFNDARNGPPPNGKFLQWRGQLQWVQQFAPDTLLVVRSDLQFSNRPVTAFDQFSIGGQNSVRGYRQDLLLADNGILASAEFRYPVLRLKPGWGIVQVVPFFDLGHVWNSSRRVNVDPNFLASVGLGLRWQQSNRFAFRLDWGIPLITVDSNKDTWQEKGLTFSLVYNLF